MKGQEQTMASSGMNETEERNRDGVMTPDEYRLIVQRLRGRRPPCLSCRDEQVLRCMATGTECPRFERFAAVPPARAKPGRTPPCG